MKNLPANAEDASWIPDPHVKEQLGPHASTVEPVPWKPCSASREVTSMRSPHTAGREWPPPLTTKEKAGGGAPKMAEEQDGETAFSPTDSSKEH